ncbi:MAG: hypothetical protein Q4G62_09435 [Pseudomonadota bacterium]|nr:hypothetical protein [Pseudomonadota bacterium]
MDQVARHLGDVEEQTRTAIGDVSAGRGLHEQQQALPRPAVVLQRWKTRQRSARAMRGQLLAVTRGETPGVPRVMSA